ncbi:DnaJ domain-containing protein [Pseudoxanthomonas gei]|uniref:DnaJ domain-containing protein n=1 Tax=Pseudoxanthomonas gei TaxID=1383030 RepID=UPI00139168E2
MIELAAGDPSRVARAAANRGEAPEQVLEAARFYVREILLFAGADAYRVLGVSPAADAAQIKLHYRHLQQWLHPDRRGNDWESVFATRINSAWGDLRSPQRRAAYEGRQPLSSELAQAFPQRQLVSQWRASPFEERRGLGWLAVGVGVACCVWLAVLVDRQAGAPAPEWGVEESSEAQPAGVAGSVEADLERAAVLMQPAPHAELPTGNRQAAGNARAFVASTGAKPGASGPNRPGPAAEQSRPRSGRPAYTEWVEDRSGGTRAPLANTTYAETSRTTSSAPVAGASTPAPAISPEQLRLLLRCGSELTAYLAGSRGPAPPIWGSVSVQDGAALLRAQLEGKRVRVGMPMWQQISAGQARMHTRLQRAGTSMDVSAEFVWRDGMWLVESLQHRSLS